MKYSFMPYRESVEDTVLLDDMKRVSILLGADTITQKEYIENGKYGIEKILYRFGSWNSALEKVGLSLSANRQYTMEEMFENIENAWMIKGKQPVRADMNNKTLSTISSSAYLRRFGTWSNALKSFIEFMNQEEQPEVMLAEHSKEEKSYAPQTSRNINLRLRWKVMQRDNYKCCKCGASPATSPNVQLHIDHITPISKGGTNTIDNLQTLCNKCNLGKGNL